MSLPVSPPVLPQLAKSASELPQGERWAYEPKWDGFRALAFVDGDAVHLQSRNGKDLTRYFPEIVFPPGRYVLDGELVQVDVTAGAALPGPTVVEVQLFYRMCLWFGRTKGFKKPEAWAYYAMQRRFRFDAAAARRLGTWGWRDLAVIAPDDDASRWFRADFQRSRVAARYAQQAGL